MNINRIVTELNLDIEALQRARAALMERQDPSGEWTTQGISKKRVCTAEGKKNIAEGMKRRWAARRKAAAKAAKEKAAAKQGVTRASRGVMAPAIER
jgi:hypothetical protein